MRPIRTIHIPSMTIETKTAPWGTDLPPRGNVIAKRQISTGATVLRRVDKADTLAFRRPQATRPRRLTSLLLNAWGRLRKRAAYHRGLRQLEQMDDRSLRDIGITDRCQLNHLARYGRRRD